MHRAMNPPQPRRVVHLELHTPDLCGASAFYGRLLRWRTERIDVRWGSYHALALGGALDGGIVECRARHATWLPYVEVAQIEAITERGRRLGASVLFEPREGPAGWSSVLRSSVGGEIAQRRLQRCLGTAEASTLATVDDWLRRLTGL